MSKPCGPSLPVLLYHWLFAAGVVAAAAIAIVPGPWRALFTWHAQIGLALGAMVLLRIAWRIAAQRLAGDSGRADAACRAAARRSPVPALLVLAMYALVLGLAATGLIMRAGAAGPLTATLHAIMAYALVATAAAHTLGALLHRRAATLPTHTSRPRSALKA